MYLQLLLSSLDASDRGQPLLLQEILHISQEFCRLLNSSKMSSLSEKECASATMLRPAESASHLQRDDHDERQDGR